MTDSTISTLASTDWNEEWKRVQVLRRKTDDAQYWNERSKNFATKDNHNPYAEDFIRLAGVLPDETVFDMGCGTGTIAVPLAAAGHKVVAGDFSQGMLDEMKKRMEAADVTTVFPKLMSWDEDWAALGVREGMVDVCVASRSISTADLGDALDRLNTIARRRVCITLPTGSSPRLDDTILELCGVRNAHGRDFQYALNILLNRGILPTVDYIYSQRKDTFDSIDEAFADFGRMIDEASAQNDTETIARGKQLLRAWLEVNLVENENAGQMDKKGLPEKALRLKTPRTVVWAFIAWDK